MTRQQCYKLLNLKTGATEQEIRRQYKRMALKLHPDINPDPKANDQFIQLTKAVEILLFSPEAPTPEPSGRTSRKSTNETEEEKKARMEEAKMRFDQQRIKKQQEDLRYYNQLISGPRWLIFKWILRVSCILSVVLILDSVLPSHYQKDELLGYSVNDHNGILYPRITAIKLKNEGIYFSEIHRSSWLNSYPEAIVEKSWILHTPVAMYTSNDFDRIRTGFDFHLGAIRWLMVLVLCFPVITWFRRRKDLTFVFLYQFSFWGVGLLQIYLLLSQERLPHLLTLGFL